jgi:Apea-like HEPN
MSFTVVPLHNLDLKPGTVVPFGKFSIQPTPGWLLNDSIVKDLSSHDRSAVQNAKHSLVSEYEADSYGFPDPEWAGTQPKGIQSLRWQSALLANMSIWMVMPSPVHLTVGFHALTNLGGQQLDTPLPNVIEREPHLFCHQRDFENRPMLKDLQIAAKLFETLSTVSRKNSVWPALRAFWGALTMLPGDMRYPLFWQGLESLFGSDTDIYGVTKRLCARISYFLADNEKIRLKLDAQVNACYEKRSDIVHGRWEDSEEFYKVSMYDTECIVRTVVRHIANKPGMLGVFTSPKRNTFLETWVKSKAFTPPSFP